MLSPTDRLDIHDLYARYAHTFDHGLAREWSELFTVDGRFDMVGDKEIVGRPALEEFARGMYHPPGMRHFVSGIVLTAAAHGARGKAYVQVMRLARDGSLRMLNLGEYEDELVREGSSWLLAFRRFQSLLPPALADSKLAVGRQLACPAIVTPD